ncbi:hypothetical protein ACGFSG_07770 [Streptomyces sp. NPDC048512]|uniref:hypothetical protein n=1 Tax=Streptomyces sp. NPDC048512 TaxID=3365563 RepID=UPI0037122E5B
MLGAGHYTTGVAKVTVSYGNKPKEYPAVMAGGAFVCAAALRPDTAPGAHYAGPSPYIHAYDASGKEVYDRTKDPQFTSEPWGGVPRGEVGGWRRTGSGLVEASGLILQG